MKTVLTFLIIALGLSTNSNAMSLNNQATCGVIFSTTSSINKKQGDLSKSKIWKQKMLDMINNMRKNGYTDNIINKAISSNIPNAMKIMKSSQYDKYGYNQYINRCLDEIEQ